MYVLYYPDDQIELWTDANQSRIYIRYKLTTLFCIKLSPLAWGLLLEVALFVRDLVVPHSDQLRDIPIRRVLHVEGAWT